MRYHVNNRLAKYPAVVTVGAIVRLEPAEELRVGKVHVDEGDRAWVCLRHRWRCAGKSARAMNLELVALRADRHHLPRAGVALRLGAPCAWQRERLGEGERQLGGLLTVGVLHINLHSDRTPAE